MLTRLNLFLLTVSVFAASSLQAQSFVDPNLPGIISYDGWENFNSVDYPGYGSYPGATPWPAPIVANIEDSGDATLNKTSGNGYFPPGNAYIYSTLGGAGAADLNPDNVVGTFAVSDASPIENLATAVFQIQIGYAEAVGTPFPTGVLPTLSYNGGSQNIPATASELTYSGEFESDFGSATADFWLFRWDLSNIEEPIESIQISFSTTNHAQVYALQLDQSDTLPAVPVIPPVAGPVSPATPLVAVEGRSRMATSRPRVVLSGSASDDGDVARVEYRIQNKNTILRDRALIRKGRTPTSQLYRRAKGTDDWSISVGLQKGVNRVLIRAVDDAGNVSFQKTVVIVRK